MSRVQFGRVLSSLLDNTTDVKFQSEKNEKENILRFDALFFEKKTTSYLFFYILLLCIIIIIYSITFIFLFYIFNRRPHIIANLPLYAIRTEHVVIHKIFTFLHIKRNYILL